MKFTTKYFMFLTSITLLFCLVIGLDVSPLLRGPAPYPPEWQWSYLFINTLNKIYFPLIIIILIIYTYWLAEVKKIFAQKIWLLMLCLIFLSLIFQLSILYYSRSGISVLIQRIINPDLNSYFTASLLIHNPIDLLKNYDQVMQHFVYHARSHPPGGVLLFYFIKQLITPFSFFINFANQFSPTHLDVKNIWRALLPSDKATAISAAFLLPLFTTLTIIPLFTVVKRLYNEKIALRSSFIYLFLPSIVFFIPINDAFLPLFSVGAFYFLVKGLQDKKSISFFLSGLTLFLGVTFNLAFLPFLLFFLLFALFFLKKNSLSIKDQLTKGFLFTFGFCLTPFLLYIFFNFNFIHLTQIILKEVPHIHSRSYTTWLFYNIYDFFVFTGIPLTIIFLTQLRKTLICIYKKQFTKIDLSFIAFFIMLVVLDLSGSTRGETGRIWSIFMPFVLIPTVAYLTKQQKFSVQLFMGILFIQALQLLVMQEFWVMLW